MVAEGRNRVDQRREVAGLDVEDQIQIHQEEDLRQTRTQL
jgi:hypothetical protein